MSKKQNQIYNFILIVIGALMILPLFVAFLNAVAQYGSVSATETIGLFESGMQDTLDAMDKSGAYIFYVITQIATVVGVAAAVAIAVFAVLKLCKVKANLAAIENILALIAMIAGVVILVSEIIFFIASTSSGSGFKTFFSGAWGWYFAFIGAFASGFLSKLAAK